jgi:hypothetical protein
MAQAPQINVDTSRKDETTKVIVYGVVALGVVALAYWGIIKPILNAVGITRDKEEREGDEAQAKLSRKQVLSPLFYRSNKDKVTISSGTASESAYNIYNGKWGGCGGFCDDEDLAVGSITSAGSLVNISYISHVFDSIYGTSMETYLDSFLEPSDWIVIDNYIEKTKNY